MINRIHSFPKFYTLSGRPILLRNRDFSNRASDKPSNNHPKRSILLRSKLDMPNTSKLYHRSSKDLEFKNLNPRYLNSPKKFKQAIHEIPSIKSYSSRSNFNKAFTSNICVSNVRYLSQVQRKINFRQYSNSSSNFPGISNLVYRFFENESKFISETLSMKDNENLKGIDISNLNDSIQKELLAQIDDYNRFVVLLSHHPLTVPYQILLHYYNSLPKVLPLDRQSLLKALIFHDAWAEFWAIVLSENATLTDLEETVDHIWKCLSANKNVELGIWHSLSAAQKEASNKNVFTSICDLFEYKFRISSSKMALFHRIMAIPSDQLIEPFRKENSDFDINIDLKAFMVTKYVQESSHRGSISRLIIEECEADPRLHKIPGFDSMAITAIPDTQLVDYFSTRRLNLCNERDLFFLLRIASPERHYPLFLSFCHSYRKGFVTSEFVINYFVLQTHLLSENVCLSIVKVHFKVLTIKTFETILTSLLETEDGCRILKTMSRKDTKKFDLLLDRVIHKKRNTDEVLTLLEMSSRKGRMSLRKTLHTLQIQKEHFARLLDCKFTEYNLTELWRYGIRERLLESSNTGKLFQKVLMKSWNVNNILKRSMTYQKNVIRCDFREQFRYATISEKRRVMIRLQAMAQALSVAEASQIADILNFLRTYLHGGKEFVIFHDKFGKSYILNHFIKYTMRFINQAGKEGKGIPKMRAVLKGLHFDSPIMQASIFEYMTIHKPKMSLDILENYKHKPSFLNSPIMNGIEQGILTSKNLEKKDRLQLFSMFQEKKSRLGFSTKLYPRSIALMGGLIFDISNNDNNRTEMQEFVRVAYQRGVPAKVIKGWTTRR